MPFFIVSTYPDGSMVVKRRPSHTPHDAERQARAQSEALSELYGDDCSVTVVEVDDAEAAQGLFPDRMVSISPLNWSMSRDNPIIRWRTDSQ